MRIFISLLTIITSATLYAQSWSSVTPMPEGVRAGNTAAYSKNGDGYLFVVSGRNEAGTIIPKNQRYQSSTNTWTDLAPHPTGIISGCTAILKDSLYVITGVPPTPPGNIASRKVYKYSINENTWTAAANFPANTTDPDAVSYQDSLIYVVGGFGSGRTRVYNSKKNQWRNATPLLPTGTISFGALTVRNDTLVYICGSQNFLSPTYYNTVRIGIIDQNDRSIINWSEARPFPGATRSFFDAWPWRNGIIITGGSTDNTFQTASGECYFYNVGTDSWTQLPSKPTAWNTGNSGSVLIGNEWKLLCSGGYSGQGYLDETEIFSEGLLDTKFSEKCSPENFKIIGDANPIIHFCLTEDSVIEMTIYDINGRAIRKIKPKNYHSGQHSSPLQIDNLSKGLYYLT